VVAVVIDTPLDFNSVTSGVCCDHFVAPVITGLVVVNTDSGVVPARSTSTHLGCFQVWPGGYGLENGAFRAGIDAGLEVLVGSRKVEMLVRGTWWILYLKAKTGPARWNREISMGISPGHEASKRN
jgi:hypothetical protein